MILITGCARSGTSLATGMLAALGLDLGERRSVNVLNENTAVRQQILKPMISRFGGDPLGQSHFPDPVAVHALPGLREQVAMIFGGIGGMRGYKDAKLTFVWQAWAAAFPAAKWVLVRRDRAAIVDSCIRTNFMRARGDDRAAWGQWVDEHLTRFDAMKAAGLDLVEVWPDRVVEDPASFEPVATHCGLSFDLDAVAQCIKPRMWHSSPVTDSGE